MSQEEVALEANITTTYYGLVERDVKSPTVRMLEKICQALDYPISDLFSTDITRENVDDLYIYEIENIIKNVAMEKKNTFYKLLNE